MAEGAEIVAQNRVWDAIVVGSGPAGATIAGELAKQGLQVLGLCEGSPEAPWGNTYGIWRDELDPLGLTHLLGHRWTNCVMYGRERIPLDREYGLFDKQLLQRHLLGEGERAGLVWQAGRVGAVEHGPELSSLTLTGGQVCRARIVVDATGHEPVLVRRGQQGAGTGAAGTGAAGTGAGAGTGTGAGADGVAYQAAYGIVGTFSVPPVEAGQMVLMDFRSDYLGVEERREPPTFLYAMDLGGGQFFVEETSLALAPAVPFERLKRRLYQRLEWMGVQVTEIHHVEHCLFPMNVALPDLTQPLIGFGGAGSMVHPASGYQVGACLRRGPGLAKAIAQALDQSTAGPTEVARAGWEALWPKGAVRKRDLYLFGLENLMGFDDRLTQVFFETFFRLPVADWSGFLSDGLTMPELVRAMVGMFGRAPNGVRWGLMSSVGRHGDLLRRAFL